MSCSADTRGDAAEVGEAGAEERSNVDATPCSDADTVVPPRAAGERRPRVAVFGPNPLLTVTLEREGEGEKAREQVHFHAGGQGVWVARMVSQLGAEPILCGFTAGRPGRCWGHCWHASTADCGSFAPTPPVAAT